MQVSRKRLAVAGACGAVLAGLAMSAAAQYAVVPTAVMANFITAGAPDPNHKVPVINGVPGAGVTNVSLALPVSVLTHGVVYTYALSSQNVTFNGTCTDAYFLEQGTGKATKVLDSHVIHTYACAPNTAWVWVINGKAVPNAPGPARLIGQVSYGALKVQTTLPVLIK